VISGTCNSCENDDPPDHCVVFEKIAILRYYSSSANYCFFRGTDPCGRATTASVGRLPNGYCARLIKVPYDMEVCTSGTTCGDDYSRWTIVCP